MEEKKLLLIINPCAGQKRANRYLAEILGLFSANHYQNIVFVTSAAGQAVDYVYDHCREVDLIVCIGGDGTLNEVIRGLIRAGVKTPIGYIPSGSTNDFASSIGLSKDILTAARDIMEGTPHSLDIGSFNDRTFSYVASFGAFTNTSYSTPQSLKNMLGHLAYILEGIKEVPKIRTIHMRVETQEGQSFEGDYIFGAVSNSTSIAGILEISPDLVSMNDGVFEIMLIKSPANARQLYQIINDLRTQQYTSEMINFCSTASATIYAPTDMNWTLDGEFEEGCEEIHVENMHQVIEVIINDKK